MSAPAEATQPVPITLTGTVSRTNLIMSWIVSPEFDMAARRVEKTSIGAVLSSASVRMRDTTSRASLSVISPKIMTLRLLKSRASSSLTTPWTSFFSSCRSGSSGCRTWLEM